MDPDPVPAELSGGRARVLHVDDHPSFCQGLALLFERERDLEVVAHASSADEALAIDARLTTDLIVIDVLLDGSDGIDLARALVARRPRRILGLSVLDEPTRIAQLLRAGAQSFALKTQPFAEILTAARATLAGTRYLAPAVRDRVEPIAFGDRRLPLDRLTRREREVFELLVQGHANEEIGRRLSIASRTVDTHRHHVMKKLEVHSISQLVRLAAKWGVLE